MLQFHPWEEFFPNDIIKMLLLVSGTLLDDANIRYRGAGIRMQASTAAP